MSARPNVSVSFDGNTAPVFETTSAEPDGDEVWATLGEAKAHALALLGQSYAELGAALREVRATTWADVR